MKKRDTGPLFSFFLGAVKSGATLNTKNGEEGHRAFFVFWAEAVLLPGHADGGHVLPRVGQQVDLGARVVVKRAHEFREGARHGDVVLRHAVRDAGLLRVHRGS